MSTQGEVNLYPYQYVLYYCGSDQKDATVYQTDLSNVCTLGFEGDPPVLTIAGWLIGGYGAPSNETLLGFVKDDVLAWYHSFYEVPIEIADAQHYKISGANLALARTSSDMIGYVVFNTTAQKCQYWSGSAWTDCWA